MKYLLICILTILSTTSSTAQSDVTVVVENIKTIKGKVMVCLVDQKEHFLEDCQNGQMVKVDGATAQVVFSGISAGQYAISTFHDKNNDDELNTNFVGIPKEPFGFSNNPTIIFGPPSYEKCLVDVSGNKTITITL